MRHLRKPLIYFLHQLLVEEITKKGEVLRARESVIVRVWFQKFKNGEFGVEDKGLSGSPKVYEDTGIESIIEGRFA